MAKLAALLLGCSILLGPRTTLAGDEPPVHGEGRALPYLKALHAKVHRLWADSFLLMAEGQLPKDHPINVPTRAVRLELVLGPEGKLADVRVQEASGATDFDTSAIDVVKASAPFDVAPEEVLSDDGKVHVVWTFARDDRRCSGAEVAIKSFPLDEAISLLVAQGRESVALERLKAADEKVRELGLSKFARAWLDRTEDDKTLALRVAAANAAVGVERGAERLRKAVDFVDGGGSAEAEVARGLAALKIPVCPLIRDALAKRTIVDTVSLPAPGTEPGDDAFVQKLKQHESRERVLHLTAEGTDGACLAFAIAVANDRRASAIDRALAISALDHSEGSVARSAIKTLLKDSDPRVRAAAVVADARAAMGKGAVFRLIPLLRDSSTEVRAAAAAGLVHVGGEAVLPQLFLVFREKDPSVYESVAAELSKLSGADSAAMLAKFLRKDDRRIQLAGARALASRRDEAAGKVVAGLASASDPEMKLLGASALDAETRAATASDAKGYGWTDSFAALARGNGFLGAADWAVAQFPKLEPDARISVMGTWLEARAKN
jgi:TonB family protein